MNATEISKVQATPDEFAAMTGIPLSTLNYWRFVDKRDGPPWRKCGRRVFYPIREGLEWLKTRPGGGEQIEGAA